MMSMATQLEKHRDVVVKIVPVFLVIIKTKKIGLGLASENSGTNTMSKVQIKKFAGAPPRGLFRKKQEMAPG